MSNQHFRPITTEMNLVEPELGPVKILHLTLWNIIFSSKCFLEVIQGLKKKYKTDKKQRKLRKKLDLKCIAITSVLMFKDRHNLAKMLHVPQLYDVDLNSN